MATPPKDDRFYSSEKLLKVFGISSIIMMIFTLWMILDDFGREWKGYQREFFVLRTKKYDKWLEEAKGKVDNTRLEELQKDLDPALNDLSQKEKEIITLEKDILKLKTREKNAITRFQDLKAELDVEKYHFENEFGHEIALGKEQNPKEEKVLKKYRENGLKVNTARNTANQLSQEVLQKESQLKEHFKVRDNLQKEIKKVRSEYDGLISAKAATELTLSKLLRTSPVVDMANPVFKIQQTVVPEIRDDIFFAHTQKVDRCTTCHMAIDTPGFEDEPNPFKTHPKLDVMLGSKSPHPIDKIGCTVCHEGRGQAVDFVRAAHTPQNEEQKKHWEKKYRWHAEHHIIEKMLPLPLTEGKCVSCHKQTEYVPKAEKLNSSIQLVRASGCYGCHRIEGWDHLRKPGPSLKRIKGKVSRDWFIKWVRSPKTFNAHARMPQIFHQSNITTTDYSSFQEAEIYAVTDYIMSLSENYSPNVHLSLGNKDKGKELFGTVGCLGCHQIDDFERTQGKFTRAPDLSSTGSKVSKDWLLSWLKNPKHYWDETTMPSFRLTDQETKDLAAYLLSKKNPEFEKLASGSEDLEAQKKVLKLYLMRDPSLAPTTDKKVDDVISAMSPKEISSALGKNAMMRYGCFGCHEIKGYETTPGIGVELTEEGSKLTQKLDFGLIHLEHTNHAWFDKKLENPRIFDKGLVKEYLDLLRMPNFEFTEEERQKLVLFILGRTAQKVLPPAVKLLNRREAEMEQGLRVVHKYNCQGCHRVEDMFTPLADEHPGKEAHDKLQYHLEGRVLAYYSEDESLGPPTLVKEGTRVHTNWVYDFVKNPYPIRSRLNIRMPSFQMSNQELNQIVTYFGNDGELEFPFIETRKVSLLPRELSNAKTLLNTLACLNCHTKGERLTFADMEGGSKGLAPDFLLAHKRLRHDWIKELLKDPQKKIPGTRMPGFWPEGVSSLPNILGGDSEKQIKLLADYLVYLGQNK